MTVLVDFQKVWEDPRKVGFPEINRHLVVEKASQQSRPLGGHQSKAVFVKIV
jgi:hypothetical protein